MKVQCVRNDLLGAFQIAQNFAPARSPKAILQNVLLDASLQNPILMATDLEVGIRIELAGISVLSPGRVVLPVTRFGMILRESSDERLDIESDGQEIIIRGMHCEFKLPAASADEFPSVVAFQESKYHEVPARFLKELIRRTAFATDTDSTRYALGGVLLEFHPDKVIAVGTDGRRLAKMEGPASELGGHAARDTMTIVPARAMHFIERTLSDADAEIKVAARSNDLLVQTPRATIYSRLVEGRFPSWQDVVPRRNNAFRIELAVGPIFAALRQAAIVTSEESRGVDLLFGTGSLVISGSTAEVGRARVQLPIAYEGAELSITLDHRFLADFFKVLDLEKTFTMEIQDRQSAALFTTDDGYGYVVMPLTREREG
jgi:DNA polymerase-3 subunit beta